MSIELLTEAYRTPGFTPSGDILSGQVVELVDENTIRVHQNTNTSPIGVALEDTVAFSNPQLFFDRRARGGLVGTVNLGIIEVSNDGRGALFDGSSFVVGAPVFWDRTNKAYTATENSPTTIRVGVCMKAPSGPEDSLRIKLEI